jgi:hypothetical protein
MISKEEFESLPEVLKGNFEPQGDKYVLKTKEPEDVSGLKTALEAERKRAKEAEKLAKKFEGLDADEIRKLLADKAKSEEDEAKKAGRFDEILKAKEAEWQKQFAAEKQRADALEQSFIENEANAAILTALTANGVIPERLEAAKQLMRSAVEIERREGKSVAKFKDATGYASEMKPEEFGAKWRENYGYFFNANGKGGSDDRNSDSGFDGKTVKREDQAALSANLEDIAAGKVTVK